MKLKILLILIMLGIGSVFNFAQAYSYSQNISSATTSNQMPESGGAWVQELGTGLEGTVTSIATLIYASGSDMTTNNLSFSLRENTTNNYVGSTGVYNCSEAITSAAINSFVNVGCDDQSPHELISTNYYWLEIFQQSYGYVDVYLVGSATNVYANGALTYQGTGGSSPSGVVDMYFDVHDIGDDVTFYLQDPPFEDYSITTDFNNWRFCIDASSVAWDEIEFQVQYGDNLTEFEDNFGPIDNWGDFEQCFTYAKGNALDAGDKVARVNAYLDSVPALSTNIWHTNIVAGDSNFYPVVIGNTQAPEGSDTGNCNQPFPVNYICRLAIPEQGFGDLIEENDLALRTAIFDQAPFAYFEEVNAYIETIDTEPDSPTLAINLQDPFGGTTGDISIPVLDPANPLLDNLDDIRPWIITGLWISFASYLLFRGFSIFRPV